MPLLTHSSITATIRELGPGLLTRLGIDQRLHSLRGSPFSILMYHGVVPERTRPRLWTQVERPEFDAQMRFLADTRPVVDLSTLIDGLAGRKPLPPGAVAITFDDGYVNVLDQALPVLEKYNLPATLFVTAGLVGTDELMWTDQLYDRMLGQVEEDQAAVDETLARVRWLKSLPDPERRERMKALLEPWGGPPRALPAHPRRILDEDELKRLGASKLFTLGAHSMTHPLLTRLAPEAAGQEIRQSKARLEALLGLPMRLFAYPDGAHDDTVVALTREAGFEAAVTTRLASVKPGDDLFRLGRYPVGQGLSVSRFALLLAGIDELMAPLRGWN